MVKGTNILKYQHQERRKKFRRKKEEVHKKEEPPKNTIVAIPMKSLAIMMKLAKNDDSEGDAHKVSIFIINGCIFPIL